MEKCSHCFATLLCPYCFVCLALKRASLWRTQLSLLVLFQVSGKGIFVVSKQVLQVKPRDDQSRPIAPSSRMATERKNLKCRENTGSVHFLLDSCCSDYTERFNTPKRPGIICFVCSSVRPNRSFKLRLDNNDYQELIMRLFYNDETHQFDMKEEYCVDQSKMK